LHYFWGIQSFLIEFMKFLYNLTLKMNHWILLMNVVLYHSFNDFMQISIIFWILVSIQFSNFFHFYSVCIQFFELILTQFLFSLYSVSVNWSNTSQNAINFKSQIESWARNFFETQSERRICAVARCSSTQNVRFKMRGVPSTTFDNKSDKREIFLQSST
jgi:hypothetical protein